MQSGLLDVGVIVRTCGRSPLFLQRALESIGAQTLPANQIVISNDGPAGPEIDQAVAAAGLVGTKVIILQREKGLLQNRSSALNRALMVLETGWVGFLDDDDTWSPNFLEEMSKVIVRREKDAGFGGVVCQTEAVYERFKDGQLAELGREPFNPHLQRLDAGLLARSNFFTINAAIWKKEVFSSVGGFREDLAVLEDWEFNVRVAQEFRLEVLPLYLARYHRRLGGGLAANSSLKEHDRMVDVLQAEWRRKGLIESDESSARRFISNLFFRLRRRRDRFRFWFRWWRRL